MTARKSRPDAMSTWTKADLFVELAARRVVAGPVLTMEELRNNEHLSDRDFWKTLDDSAFPGPAFKMSETPWQLHDPAPAVGADTAEWTS